MPQDGYVVRPKMIYRQKTRIETFILITCIKPTKMQQFRRSIEDWEQYNGRVHHMAREHYHTLLQGGGGPEDDLQILNEWVRDDTTLEVVPRS